MNILSKLINKISDYIDVRVNSIKLSFIERTSLVISNVIFILIAIFIAFGILLFFSFGIAEYFSWLTESRIGGFFLTMAMYLLLFILVIVFRKKIISRFADIFIGVFTNMDEDDESKKEDK